jgi:hypothetical protein
MDEPDAIEHGRARSADALCFALWIVMQVSSLALSAWQVTLWRGQARPPEMAAVDLLLIVQVIGAALLLAILPARWFSGAALIALALPFEPLAALMAGQHASGLGWASAFVAAYLLTLLLWRRALRSTRMQLIAMACFLTLSLAGPLSEYLRAEFLPGDGPITATWSPLMAALRQLRSARALLPEWLWLGSSCAAGVVALLAQRSRAHTSAGAGAAR